MSTPNKERLRLWVEDLRTTDAKQGTRSLRKGDAWCCLGRACEVYRVATGDGEWVGGRFVVGNAEGENNYLPYEVRWWLGFDSHNPDLRTETGENEPAAYLNDQRGYSFPEIADAVWRTFGLGDPRVRRGACGA